MTIVDVMRRTEQHVRVFKTPIDGVHLTVSASAQHFERHWHDAYGFGLLDHGAQRWRSRCGSVEAFSGSVINTNPGEVHDGQPIGGAARFWRIVSVPVDVMAALLESENRDLEIAPPVIVDRRLAASLERLFSVVEQLSQPASHESALAVEEALVESCVLLMARHGAPRFQPRARDSALGAVRDRLTDEGMPTPSLAELARIAGASKYQVLRAFKKQHGMPPHAWLLSLRAERARGFIRRGLTLATAAARAGFADQSHMTRTFRRYYGYTPRAWQRAG